MRGPPERPMSQPHAQRRDQRFQTSAIDFPSMADFGDLDDLLCFVDTVDDPVSPDAKAVVAGEGAAQTNNVGVFAGLGLQELEAAAETPLEGRIRIFDKTPRGVGDDDAVHLTVSSGSSRSG